MHQIICSNEWKRRYKSVQFSCSVVSNSLRPHRRQQARFPVHHQLPELAQTHVYQLSDVIQSSHLLLLLTLQPFPASGSFLMSQLFALGGQSIGASALALVLPISSQDWFPLWLTGWISLKSKGLSRVFSNTTVQKHQILQCSAFFIVQLSSSHMTTRKTIAWLYRPLLAK